jgi:hypothetical protein
VLAVRTEEAVMLNETVRLIVGGVVTAWDAYVDRSRGQVFISKLRGVVSVGDEVALHGGLPRPVMGVSRHDTITRLDLGDVVCQACGTAVVAPSP